MSAQVTSREQRNNAAPITIVGLGIAGYNAALGLRQSGYEGQIEVFTAGDERPASPILTSYYASGAVSFDQCFPWSQERINHLNLDIHAHCPVHAIDTNAHTLTTAQGTHTYSKCIITTGGSPVQLPFNDECALPPFTLRTMQDAQVLHDALANEQCSRVLISGASMVAVKMLEAALRKGKICTLVGRKNHLLSRASLPQAARRFESAIAKQGATLMFNNSIAHIEALRDDAHPFGRLLHVTFAKGETATFDLVLIAHGMKSNIDFLNGQIDCDQGILVDEFMHTSNPDLYAAGDVAQGRELITGEKMVVGIFKQAAEQGFCAGITAAAELAGNAPNPADACASALPANTITCNDALFISAGTNEITPARHIETEEQPDMTIVQLFEGERLVGFNISCDHDELGGNAYELGGMLTRRIREDNTPTTSARANT